ncbi:unnamed protein product [Pleuronectes platessa]|uniref:Uncharacterized protein n=1 Tax=Pleuronectes platessa TaxID=8262 RepID=A0A9N7Z6W7_PLEPL|nr:unnamed protein product [Pleuronectes platessa]
MTFTLSAGRASHPPRLFRKQSRRAGEESREEEKEKEKEGGERVNKHTAPFSPHLNSPAPATVLQDPRGSRRAAALLTQAATPMPVNKFCAAMETMSSSVEIPHETDTRAPAVVVAIRSILPHGEKVVRGARGGFQFRAEAERSREEQERSREERSQGQGHTWRQRQTLSGVLLAGPEITTGAI